MNPVAVHVDSLRPVSQPFEGAELCSRILQDGLVPRPEDSGGDQTVQMRFSCWPPALSLICLHTLIWLYCITAKLRSIAPGYTDYPDP
jgi:hypothetical protein